MFSKLLRRNSPNLLKSLPFFCFLLAFINTFSQDTVEQNIKTEFTNLRYYQTQPNDWKEVDTSIDFIQRYDPIHQNSVFRENLGNYGSPTFSLKLRPFTDGNFLIGLREYDIYRYKPKTLSFYDSYTPFTHLKFNQRFSGNQQDLSGVHARNITPFWNGSVRFTRRNSEGLYLNQQTDQTRIGINTRFSSPNGRYKGFLSGILNDFKNQENGGVESIKGFKALEGSDRNRASVNLAGVREGFHEKSFNYDHFLFTGPENIDTFFKKNDTFLQRSVQSQFHFHHHIGYGQKSYGYRDKDPGAKAEFYPAIYNDSSLTHDSLNYWLLSNAFAISNFSQSDTPGNESLKMRGGVEWNISQYHFEGTQENFQNLKVKGRIQLPLGKHQFYAKSHFFPLGKYQGNFKSEEAITLALDSFKNLQFGHKIQKRDPALVKTRMRGNHLKWDKNFKDPLINRFHMKLNQNRMNLNAKVYYTLIHNYTYFGRDISPKQIKRPISQIATQVNHHYNFGKVHLSNNFHFQYYSNNEVIHRPDWSLKSSIFYKDKLFDNNLLLATGIDFRYNKPYQANAYFPDFNIFYLQDRRNVGGYPVFDLFLNFRIERFRGFLKVGHLNKGLSGDDYFILPNYPLYPRVFALGVRWMFYD